MFKMLVCFVNYFGLLIIAGKSERTHIIGVTQVWVYFDMSSVLQQIAATDLEKWSEAKILINLNIM